MKPCRGVLHNDDPGPNERITFATANNSLGVASVDFFLASLFISSSRLDWCRKLILRTAFIF